jgi:dephospho-CoA kinase
VFGLALTGGIGSGKSSVSDRLVARGADLIDADLIVHEIQRPGGSAYEPIDRSVRAPGFARPTGPSTDRRWPKSRSTTRPPWPI